MTSLDVNSTLKIKLLLNGAYLRESVAKDFVKKRKTVVLDKDLT